MAITYTITTNFGAKDSLPTGDSGKIIKGAEFTTEFNAIQSAFALAATAANPTFTGTATIPTAAVTTFTFGGVNVTATAAELNLLDGVTATTAELNLLDGVTATTAELNILDGVTATTAELNYVDGVTSNVQTQLDAKAPTASPTFTGTVNMSGATVSLANDAISGDKVEGGTIAATTITDLTTSTINIGLWDIELDGSDLRFQYNGTDVFRITTAGAIIAKDEVTAFGSP
jgi:hypothetical protein